MHDTVRIKVRLSGHLRRYGSGDRDLALPRTATVRHVLHALSEGSADLRGILLDSAGAPNTQLLLFVDDEQSHVEHVLSDARSVTLMLPISGG